MTIEALSSFIIFSPHCCFSKKLLIEAAETVVFYLIYDLIKLCCCHHHHAIGEQICQPPAVFDDWSSVYNLCLKCSLVGLSNVSPLLIDVYF